MIVGWLDNIIPFLNDLVSFLSGNGIFPFVGLFLFVWVIKLFKSFIHMKIV